MKIHPAAAQMFHVDKHMNRDMMKLGHFSQFCEHAKKWVKKKRPNPKQ